MAVPAFSQSPAPVIQRAPGIQLTAQQVALLQQRFAAYREIFAEQSFHSGYSGAAVYLVSRDPDAPVVVKFAHPFDLQREVAAYHEFVERAAPQNTARLQGDLIASADGQLGLIVYTFAGGNLHTGATSFVAFFQRQGGPATAKVFDHLFGIYGRQWWASNELRRIVFAEEYDRLLPVQLTLRSSDATPSTDPTPIQAGQTSSLTLRQLQPGQAVQLTGLRVIKQQAERLTLYADPPANERSAPLRIRLEDPLAATYRPGDLLPPQLAVVQATRWESLVASAQEAIPTFDASAERFAVDGVIYPNPLRHLTPTLDLAQDVRVSIVHGDLNLQNILVDPASSFAWLIDFAETHRGPTLLDLQRMEVQVLAKLLPPCLPRPTQGTALVASLLDALHTTTPALTSPVPALQEPYTLLVTLREWARQFLVDDRQWDEYYRGLLLALIGALKFDELDQAARALVLVGAAKACALIGKPLATPVDPAPGQPPYKGLQAFDVADAELFFGREKLIDEVVRHVREHPFLAIVGPSGSGKSSLVRAGLSAALVGQTTDAAAWAVSIITPTAQPLATLTHTLAQNLPGKGANQPVAPGSPAPFPGKVAASPGRTQRWLLVVDQFEELFTLCRDKAEQQRFVERLLATAGLGDEARPPLATVLITLRADFYADCAEFEPLRLALARWQKYIGPLSATELRRAIEEPAQRNGWTVEPDLVALLLRDVGQEPGALPLLAQALLETWNRRRGRLLTVAGYVASGSVQGAIARTAETVYREQLTGEQQAIARQIFLELTEIGDSGQNTRRRVAQPALVSRWPAGAGTQTVLDTLARARLITTAANTVEVAHEALIRAWPTLQAWIEADREALRAHRYLTQAAQEWEQAGRDPDLLYRGVRLAQALEYQQAGAIHLNALETTFLQASLALRDREAEARERQRQLELNLAQEKAAAAEAQALAQSRRAQRLRWIAGWLVIPLLVLMGMGILRVQSAWSAWQPVDNFPKNAVSALAYSPALSATAAAVLCASTTDAGIGCSLDGITWNIYQQNLPTGAIVTNPTSAFPNTVWNIHTFAFDPADPQRLVILLPDQGLYQSRDRGVTWQALAASEPLLRAGRKLAVMGRQIFVATTAGAAAPEQALYASRDEGASWELLNGAGAALPQQVWSVEIDPAGAQVYVGGQDGLYRNSLAGPWQWQQVAPLAAVEDIAPIWGDPGAFYVGAYDEAAGVSAIYHLANTGVLQPDSPLAQFRGRIMAVTPHPNPASPIAAYALNCDGLLVLCEVLVIRHTGEVASLGNRPLRLHLPPFSNDLLAIPTVDGVGVRLLLGHRDGLMEYRP